MNAAPKQNPADALWARLAAAVPEDVAARAAVAYDAAEQAYRVPLVGAEVRILPGSRQAVGPDGPASFDATLVCVQYLLTARDEPSAGEIVDPRSLSYGDFFFRGPHDLPTAKLADAFGRRVGAFRVAAEALGGRAVAMGDAAYEFRALPRVPVTVVLWAADDEFPARAQFLFDRGADRQLPLDALWLLASILVKRLIAALG